MRGRTPELNLRRGVTPWQTPSNSTAMAGLDHGHPRLSRLKPARAYGNFPLPFNQIVARGGNTRANCEDREDGARDRS